MKGRSLRADPQQGFTQVVGIGGIGAGKIIALQGNHTLGRNESRLGKALAARDYCKLHIVEHYIAALMGTVLEPESFRVLAAGNVGDDSAGIELLKEMAEAGIDARYVRVLPNRDTLFSLCFMYPDGSGGNLTTSNSAASALSSAQIEECREELLNAGERGIALCLPEVPIEIRRQFLDLATECGSYRVASFASSEIQGSRRMNLFSRVDLLALNRDEAAEIADQNAHHRESLDACSEALAAANPDIRVLVSAGSDGVYVFEGGAWSHYEAIPAEVVSTAGAGDALLGGVIAGLAAGLPLTTLGGTSLGSPRGLSSAIDLGLLVGSFSVTSLHTIHPGASLEALLAFAKDKGFRLSPEFWNTFTEG